ncbi:ATP-binding protein [Flavobacterium sp. NRK1]|uniref:sensor histidine kinase n=1 Tax=Flavobacterium sp. NRK1 TaxID=2954929 RepID=UPI00209211BB|nr:ATP-binding protein [Flavobacterium sp. NRK1]MCO6148188.1 ATP-binding protein [Flavobacterium sp. NRK1]
MKKVLFVLLLLSILPLKAQEGWPEPFLVYTDSLGYSQDLPKENWQFINIHQDTVSFNDIIKPEYSSKFNYSSTGAITVTGSKSYVWVRYTLKNTTPVSQIITFATHRPKEHIYVLANNKWKHFVTGDMVPWSKRNGIKQLNHIKYTLKAGEEIKVYLNLEEITLMTHIAPAIGSYLSVMEGNFLDKHTYSTDDVIAFGFFGFILFAVIFNTFFYYVNREKVYLVYSLLLLFSALLVAENDFSSLIFCEFRQGYPVFMAITIIGFIIMLIQTFRFFFRINIHFRGWDKFLVYFSVLIAILGTLVFLAWQNGWVIFLVVMMIIISLITIVFIVAAIILLISLLRKKDKEARLFIIAAMPFIFSPILTIILQMDWVVPICGMWTIIVLSWGMFARFKSLQMENARAALEKEEERNRLIAQQKEELQQQVEERTAELRQSLEDLKQTQNQLIQSEKMASLGELTAGIAHEIQNPLNFVNNFSDVSVELITEMEEELQKGDAEEALAIAQDVKQNLEKIAHHGRRADGIVKGMLQHSRASSGQKEPVDINVLADEYLRLAYHGLRAKDKSFNATLVTEFDDTLPKINMVGQDVGRVLLNLFTNAFYATQQKLKTAPSGYMPTLTVSTSQNDDEVIIKVKDNGTGIPNEIRDKILQPFFTTKPTGEGTGLGLSLSYDIIVKGHGGSIDINSVEGEFSEFIITLKKD